MLAAFLSSTLGKSHKLFINSSHSGTYKKTVDSITQDAKAWKYLTDKGSLRNYTYPLHNLAYSVLESMSDTHPSAYKFPVTSQMKLNGKVLQRILKSPTQDPGDVLIFHNFIYPLVSREPSVREDDKWSMVMECWLAVYNLHPQGHFSPPHDVTRLFAQMEYICRGATLYQSFLRKDSDFEGSLYRYVISRTLPAHFHP